jgi:hypothetical protein
MKYVVTWTASEPDPVVELAGKKKKRKPRKCCGPQEPATAAQILPPGARIPIGRIFGDGAIEGLLGHVLSFVPLVDVARQMATARIWQKNAYTDRRWIPVVEPPSSLLQAINLPAPPSGFKCNNWFQISLYGQWIMWQRDRLQLKLAQKSMVRREDHKGSYEIGQKLASHKSEFDGWAALSPFLAGSDASWIKKEMLFDSSTELRERRQGPEGEEQKQQEGGENQEGQEEQQGQEGQDSSRCMWQQRKRVSTSRYLNQFKTRYAARSGKVISTTTVHECLLLTSTLDTADTDLLSRHMHAKLQSLQIRLCVVPVTLNCPTLVQQYTLAQQQQWGHQNTGFEALLDGALSLLRAYFTTSVHYKVHLHAPATVLQVEKKYETRTAPGNSTIRQINARALVPLIETDFMSNDASVHVVSPSMWCKGMTDRSLTSVSIGRPTRCLEQVGTP